MYLKKETAARTAQLVLKFITICSHVEFHVQKNFQMKEEPQKCLYTELWILC